MAQRWILWVFLFFVSGIFAQEIETPYKSKKIAVSKDAINLLEESTQNKIGTSFTYNSDKGFSLNGKHSIKVIFLVNYLDLL